MQNQIVRTVALTVLWLATTIPIAAAEDSSLDSLQGKWIVKKTSSEGQPFTQAIEIAKDKLTFALAGSDGEVRFFAKATVKSEKLGPFKVLALSSIEAGRSSDETKAVEDDRLSLYTFRDGALTLASNFDKVRENQEPTVDTYTRVGAPKKTASAAADDTDKLVGAWKFDVTLGDSTRDYELRVVKTDGKLGGAMISPRSGETKLKSITYTEGKLAMELVRDIQGTEATFLYAGKWEGEKLSGTVAVKGFEDQYSGKWTAARK